MKRVVVLLSGCGVMDGSEIHEAVLTLLFLDKAGAEAICAAPDVAQHHVVNHLTGQPAPGATRNVKEEAARIARGNIRSVGELKPGDYDAVILPGGFGAAKNLCTFASEGDRFKVEPSVEAFLKAAHSAGKPIGFICIAPAIAARLFEGASFTIGNDAGTAKTLEAWGARHVDCPVDEFVVDKERKIVSTPAYMLAQNISEAEAGISKLVRAVLELV